MESNVKEYLRKQNDFDYRFKALQERVKFVKENPIKGHSGLNRGYCASILREKLFKPLEDVRPYPSGQYSLRDTIEREPFIHIAALKNKEILESHKDIAISLSKWKGRQLAINILKPSFNEFEYAESIISNPYFNIHLRTDDELNITHSISTAYNYRPSVDDDLGFVNLVLPILQRENLEFHTNFGVYNFNDERNLKSYKLV
jgi:hypothetical protein